VEVEGLVDGSLRLCFGGRMRLDLDQGCPQSPLTSDAAGYRCGGRSWVLCRADLARAGCCCCCKVKRCGEVDDR